MTSLDMGLQIVYASSFALPWQILALGISGVFVLGGAYVGFRLKNIDIASFFSAIAISAFMLLIAFIYAKIS